MLAGTCICKIALSLPYREIHINDIHERHPVRAFDTYWSFHATEVSVPRRNQINPGDIAALLQWLLVLEAVPLGSGLEFRYRLSGTGCTELFGIDYTGKMLGENLTPEGAEIRRIEFAKVIKSERPILSTTNLPIKAKDFITVYRGVFPVSSSGCGTDQIFVVLAPLQTECLVRLPQLS